MKQLLALIISIYLITKPVVYLPECNIQTIKQALPPIIFYEQAIDGNKQSIILTRFLHNKVGVLGSQFAKCYFDIFSLKFVYQNLGVLGVGFFVYYFYFIFSKKKLPLTILTFLVPIIPILLNIPILIPILYKSIAVIGAFLLLVTNIANLNLKQAKYFAKIK